MALFFVIHAVAAIGQSETDGQKKLQFDVASVRQNQSNDRPRSNFAMDNGYAFSTVGKDDTFTTPGGLFSATNMSLLTYISFAYKLNATQFLSLRAWQLGFNGFVGGSAPLPKWTYGDRFDIQARAAGNPTQDQMRLMLQSLLAERFGLVVHMETREVPIYALLPLKPGSLGPKLRVHPESDTCSADSQVEGYPPVCGIVAHLVPSVPGRSSFGGRAVTMTVLAASLPTQTGMATLPHPIIDETGLTGKYDFALEWTQTLEDGSAPESGGQLFQEALKKQLGLRLESKNGPVEVLVVDHVEHPSAN